MKTFGAEEEGFIFYLNNENWRELTKEEKERFGISGQVINYMINQQLQKEFIVVGDSYSADKEYLDCFYETNKKNLISAGVKILNEEQFVGNSFIGKTQVKAYKTFSQMPDGHLQVSYFMRLGGNKEGHYLYGCLTTSVLKDHDDNEGTLVSALNNWEYFDVK